MKECLVIIDVQNGFLTDETRHVLNKIKTTIENKQYEHIVATRFVNSSKSPHYLLTKWDQMMDENSQALAQIVKDSAERVFDKDTNSCFTEEFVTYISDEKIEKLVFLGIDTDCCVLKSAYDSFDRKIPFEVLTECCASTGGEDIHNFACQIMLRNFGGEHIK